MTDFPLQPMPLLQPWHLGFEHINPLAPNYCFAFTHSSNAVLLHLSVFLMLVPFPLKCVLHFFCFLLPTEWGQSTAAAVRKRERYKDRITERQI